MLLLIKKIGSVLFAVLLLQIAVPAQINNDPAELKASLTKLIQRINENKISTDQALVELDSIRQVYSSTDAFKNVFLLTKIFLNNLSFKNEKEYTVKDGDNLWTIAEKETGNPYNWNKIYETNDTSITNPDLLAPNQKIIIPVKDKITESDSTISKLLAVLEFQKEEKLPVNKKDSVLSEAMEIENLIVDETLSKIGRDYFDLFYTKWEEQITGANNYSIVISEKPLPNRGTQISIRVNDLEVYQSFIQPRYELIEQSVNDGIYMVYTYLMNYEAVQKELEEGDMKGSGIY